MLSVVLGRMAAGEKVDPNAALALVAGALAAALKQWQSSEDVKAEGKG